MARDPTYDVELICWSCKSYFTIHRVAVEGLGEIRGTAVCNKCGAAGDLASVDFLHEIVRIDNR
jgi:hypothetical protein